MKIRTFLIASVITVTVLVPGMALAATNSLPVYAYITCLGSDSVAMIDTATDTIAANVPVGHLPFGVGVVPDGSRAYIANASDDTVSVIDSASQSVIATIPVFREPLGVCVSPDGAKVYVACTGSDINTTGRLEVIDTVLNVVTAEVPLSGGPSAGIVSPDSSRIFVTTIGGGVYVINAATLEVTDVISLGGFGCDSITLATPHPFGFVVNSPIGQLGVFNSAANKAKGSIPVGQNVQAVAASPNGKKVYATDSTLEQVSVISSTSRHILQQISLPGSNAMGISLTPDGKKAYVAGNGNDSVIVIDTACGNVLTNIPGVLAPYAKGQFIATRLPD